MLKMENGVVKLLSGVEVCRFQDIPEVISCLVKICQENVLEDNVDEIEENDIDERYTSEGIDRYFKSTEMTSGPSPTWEADSLINWAGIPGPVLFSRYPRHAECYCEGALEYNFEPTYEGFRQWLINLRDQDNGR